MIFESLFPATPFPYQLAVRDLLRGRENVLLTAPTGAGKTLAVLAPFLAHRQEMGIRRLIYCLPLRTLAQGIYAEARELCRIHAPELKVTIQTGEQRDDDFFHFGDIIVTTYDQFLSGALFGAYGQSKNLRGINAAIPAGNLVVYDEFHLMHPQMAFSTAVRIHELFRGSSQSCWMTATATSPLREFLISNLGVRSVDLTLQEQSALFDGRNIRRTFEKHDSHCTFG